MGLRVVAEGVEDEATMRYVASLGCDLVQGFHVARPVTGERLRAWLEEAGCRATTAASPVVWDALAPQAA